MRCVILFVYFIVYSTISCNAQEWIKLPAAISKNSLSLKGKVDTVREYKYAIAGDTAKNIIAEKTLVFNKKGWLTDEVIKFFGSKGKMTSQGKRIYYSGGRQIALKKYTSDKLTDSISFYYNRKGQLKQKYTYKNGNELHERISYSYLHDSLFTIRKKDAGNSIENMLKIDYSTEDTAKEITLLNEQLQLLWRQEIITKKKSDTVYVTQYYYTADDSLTGMQSYLINKEGNILEAMTMNGNKQVEAYTTYTYKKQLPETIHTFNNNSEQQISYTYKYDNANNVVYIGTYKDGTLSEEAYREIAYYSLID